MEGWYASKYCVAAHYIMKPATAPLVEQPASRKTDYGAVEDRDETDKDPTDEHRDTLQRSGAIGIAPNVAHFYREPKSYLGYAILVTIFCCLPLGIPAIYYSRKAKQHSIHGEWIQAHRTALKSRQQVQMALAIGLVLWFIGLIIVIIVTHPQPL